MDKTEKEVEAREREAERTVEDLASDICFTIMEYSTALDRAKVAKFIEGFLAELQKGRVDFS